MRSHVATVSNDPALMLIGFPNYYQAAFRLLVGSYVASCTDPRLTASGEYSRGDLKVQKQNTKTLFEIRYSELYKLNDKTSKTYLLFELFSL